MLSTYFITIQHLQLQTIALRMISCNSDIISCSLVRCFLFRCIYSRFASSIWLWNLFILKPDQFTRPSLVWLSAFLLEILLFIWKPTSFIDAIKERFNNNNNRSSKRRQKIQKVNLKLFSRLWYYSVLLHAFIFQCLSNWSKLVHANLSDLHVWVTTITLVYLNSSINLYCWREREIRAAMKQLFCRWF